MHFTRVVFPAPLSPTSAVTSPFRASKLTCLSTCTAPKLLSTPLIRRITSSGIAELLHPPGGFVAAGRAGSRDRPPTDVSADSGCRALGGVCAGARLGLRRVTVVDRIGHIALVDRDRRGQDGRYLLAGLRVGHRSGGVRDATGGEHGCRVDGWDRLELGRLVDREALVAVHDVLEAVDRGVLAGDRDLAVQALLLQRRDDRDGHAVIGDHDRVEVLVRVEHRLERDTGLLVVPLVDPLVVELLPTGLLAEHRVIAVLEERRVVVGLRSVDVDVVDRALALDLLALDQRVALCGADRYAVERDVEAGAAAEGEPV